MSTQPLLSQLYTVGSLANTADGFRFGLKNRLFDATLDRVDRVAVDGEDLALSDVTLDFGDRQVRADEVGDPVPFALRQRVEVRVVGAPLTEGRHDLVVEFHSEPFGGLGFEAHDHVAETLPDAPEVPRDREDNWSPAIVAERQRVMAELAGQPLEHVTAYSFDPGTTRGNVENFVGVAQVPVGLAGPLRVNGEHAQGEFLIPMATTEGTLVASYNRGMKVINLSGGVTCTVQDDRMQRAPVFVFDSAREARDFRAWVLDHLDEIGAAAEATTSTGKLVRIEIYLASKMAFLRFNFSTGDAAGQNMVGKATFAACSWILEQVNTVRRFFLEANFATDKKASSVNMMRTRGKRVTAEVTVPRHVLTSVMRVHPESLTYHAGVANVGSFLAGANNNGLHAANGITALFIATGQDVANVSESSAAVVYTELTPDGDLYLSITLPALIVASYGGGTALATQRECLRVLGCDGTGKARKLAEIIAGVVLAGELSLASAISSMDWVSSHEMYGRNR